MIPLPVNAWGSITEEGVVQRMLLKSKIHRATVTDANLEYEGSVSIDSNLLKQADIIPFERIEVYNITNGQRFATYAIEAQAGSGEICINGAAAHLTKPGDLVIIASYVNLNESELAAFKPKLVFVDSSNRARSITNHQKHPALPEKTVQA